MSDFTRCPTRNQNTSYPNEKSKSNEDCNEIDALTNEIDALKKVITDQEYVIDDLVLERDQISDDRYAQRVKYETSQQKLQKELELCAARIKELKDENKRVVTERNEISAHNFALQAKLENIKEENQSYSAAVKATGYQNANVDIPREEEPCLKICSSAKSTDSGVDMQSLTKLIDDRVGIMIGAKLSEHVKPTRKNASEKEFVELVYANNTVSTEPSSTTTIPDRRELNIIIHGIKEESIKKEHDQTVIKELFDTVGLEYHPTTSIDRLGIKTPNKMRPIRLTMETQKEKSEFMSKLGRLKYGPETFQKISITDDYTQEERKEIRRWVEEAKERTKSEEGYEWKVRGSPRSKLRLIKVEA